MEEIHRKLVCINDRIEKMLLVEKLKIKRAAELIRTRFREYQVKRQTQPALVHTQNNNFDLLQVDNIILSQFPTKRTSIPIYGIYIKCKISIQQWCSRIG